MDFRTDLALERSEASPNIRGAKIQRRDLDNARITIVRVENEEAARELGKPIGKYVTVEVPPFTRDAELLDGRLTAVSGELSSLLPREGAVLIAGLGNESITPDALGPQTAEMLLATRHISSEVSDGLGLGRLRPVAVITPGVLGKTGMETAEIISAAVQAVKPCAVITVDALACRSLSRLGCTVQMSDSGITPGGGVGNARSEISEKTLGVPVIALGVPTVIDAATLCADLSEKAGGGDNMYEKFREAGGDMIVTPKDIDMLTSRAAKLVALAVNCAMQPNISPEDMLTLTG